MNRGGIALAVLALIFGAANGPEETRSLFTVKEFPAFEVVVPPQTSAWCGDAAQVTIRAQTAEQFVQNRPVIERIVGGLRAVMSFECPQATTLLLTGKVAGVPVYHADAAAAGDWKLANVELISPERQRLVANAATVASCDALASGPGDPQAVAPSVSDNALDAAAAVAACRKAVAVDSKAARLRYELARGLLKQGATQDAMEQLVTAGESGHGGALALLGDIYLSGASGVEADPATAKKLYERAAQAGFTPAKAVLAQFQDQTQAVASAAREEKQSAAQPVAREQSAANERSSSGRGSLNLAGYEYPSVIQGIYDSDFDNVGGERGVKIYLVNMAETFRNVCRGSFTINEMNGLRSAVIDKSDVTPQAGWNAAYDLMANIAGYIQNPGSVMQQAQQAQSVQSMPEQASNDAMLFVERNNCGSSAFDRFTANLRSFVKNQSLSANLSAPEYRNACMAGAQSTYYSKDDFCGCFVTRANSASLTRGEKKSLLTSFWPTATSLMKRDPQHFGVCNGSLAR